MIEAEGGVDPPKGGGRPIGAHAVAALRDEGRIDDAALRRGRDALADRDTAASWLR